MKKTPSNLKTLHIVRGVSGSGKSTFAKQLIEHSHQQGLSTTHAEADQFRYIDGKYHYHPKNNESCHRQCQKKVQTAMQNKIAVIVVANTFIQKSMLSPYIQMAESFDYQVKVHIMTGNYNNVHSVPTDVVQQQRQDFEH